MHRRFRMVTATVVVALLSWTTVSGTSAAGDDPAMPAVQASGIAAVLSASVHGSPGRHPFLAEVLKTFYENRQHGRAWIVTDGLTPAAHALVRRVTQARRDGLPPLRALPTLVDSHLNDRTLDRLDVALTEVFLTYGLLLGWGQVAPEVVHPAWDAGMPPQPDLLGALTVAVAEGDVDAALDRLAPAASSYRALRAALGRYLDVEAAGGWKPVPGGGALKRGDTGERVRALRERLRAEGDLASGNPDEQDAGEVYDEEVAAAVRRFQTRHGLKDDGILGPVTLAALNVPVTTRLRQIVLNMERHRWVPPLAPRRVSVNVAAHALTMFHDDREVMRMDAEVPAAIVTAPVVAGRMAAILVTPHQHSPPGIGGADAAAAPVIGPRGPQHGRVEFQFLHRFGGCPVEAAAAGRRLLTDGECLRVDDPVALAVFALADDPHRVRPDRADVARAVASGEHRRFDLPRDLPVYVLYWTAWADAEGGVSFREDPYGFDEQLTLALMGLG